MDKYESEEWLKNHDMPHEHIMDLRGMKFSDLSLSIQRQIKAFDILFNVALKDGYIDEEEERILITESYLIAKRIEMEIPE